MFTMKDITSDPALLGRRINEYFERCDAANGSPACLVCKDGCGDKCASCLKKRLPYILAELKFNNGRFSEYFMDKWIMKDSINKGKNDISLAQLIYPPSWKGKDGNTYKRYRMVYFTGKGSSKTYTVKG